MTYLRACVRVCVRACILLCNVRMCGLVNLWVSCSWTLVLCFCSSTFVMTCLPSTDVFILSCLYYVLNTLTNVIHFSEPCVDVFGVGKKKLLAVRSEGVCCDKSDSLTEQLSDCLCVIWRGDWQTDCLLGWQSDWLDLNLTICPSSVIGWTAEWLVMWRLYRLTSWLVIDMCPRDEVSDLFNSNNNNPYIYYSALSMTQSALQIHIQIIHTCNGLLWTIPTGASSGEVSCPRTQRLYRRSGVLIW